MHLRHGHRNAAVSCPPHVSSGPLPLPCCVWRSRRETEGNGRTQEKHSSTAGETHSEKSLSGQEHDTIGTTERAFAPQRAEQRCGRRVGCRTFARVAMMLALGPRWSRLPQRRLLNVQRAPASSPTPVRSAGQHPGPARRAPWCARRLCGVLRLAQQPASHKPLEQAPLGARN